MQFVGVLENASEIGFVHRLNDIWSAEFSLPITDPLNAICKMHNIVDIFKDGKSLGKYRILRQPDEVISDNGTMLKYECEHAICFLLDDVIDGYLEIGGTGIPLRQCLELVLNRQRIKRWVLDVCDFSPQYQHKFENSPLLPAIFGMATSLDQPYRWTYNTDVYPFKLSLTSLSDETNCMIRRKVNMTEIKREVDSTTLCTRLYCKGYGEGINQLNIKKVNNGLPYIDADTINKWGVKSSFFIDTKVENAETLLALGRKVLERVKNPYISYTANAIDLSRITGHSWHEFDEGKKVSVKDDVENEEISAVIVEFSQKDIFGKPLDCDIKIANKDKDVASSIADLANRAAIASTYSQGATNLYSQQFADNADSTHPAIMRVYVPRGCVRINQVLLYWKLERFRAYETGAEAGGGTATTTASGGGSASTSGGGGGGTVTSTTGWSQITGYADFVQSHQWDLYNYESQDYIMSSEGNASIGYHRHKLNRHKHNVSVFDSGHSHSVSTSSHSHSVSIPDHSHSFTLNPHTHAITYGIYEGNKATSISLKVDGNVVPSGAIQSEMDIVPYLSVDSNGKINRGTWHTIEIIPNGLSRIEANLFVQTFVQSIGGGDY
ncbi:MAG: hypothetical protein GX483_09025 [Actinomycetaceae bacterium]|nr:hypothetical protein [Actinomycetaceae bacterium]